MNTRLFEAQMKLHGDTIESLGRKIGRTRTSLCNKKNGTADFTYKDMKQIISLYCLTPDETYSIFFADDVSFSDTERNV